MSCQNGVTIASSPFVRERHGLQRTNPVFLPLIRSVARVAGPLKFDSDSCHLSMTALAVTVAFAVNVPEPERAGAIGLSCARRS